jgi:hypothetical protein
MCNSLCLTDSHCGTHTLTVALGGAGLFAGEEGLAKSVVLVATRFIDNEELLLNYRLNPANPYPTWYHQPDLLEAQRRWGKLKVLY